MGIESVVSTEKVSDDQNKKIPDDQNKRYFSNDPDWIKCLLWEELKDNNLTPEEYQAFAANLDKQKHGEGRDH